MKPMNDAVIVEDLNQSEENSIDSNDLGLPYCPDPIEIEVKGSTPEVFSVGDGEVVAVFDDVVIVKTSINQTIIPPEGYKVPKITPGKDGVEYVTEWITPTPRVITRRYYISYGGINTDLIIGDTVVSGQLIGELIGESLRYSVTTESGFDIHPFSI